MDSMQEQNRIDDSCHHRVISEFWLFDYRFNKLQGSSNERL